MTKAMANRMMMTPRLMSAPRFFFSRLQESFQKPTGGPAMRSPSSAATPADSKRSGVKSRCLVSMSLLLLRSGDADTGVYDPVQDVLYQEGDYEHDGEEQRRAQDHRVVVDDDRVHELVTDAGHREDLLDHQRTGYYVDGQRRHDGDERDQGVAQDVPYDHRQAGESLGFRQGDVVLPHYLQHLRPDEPRNRRDDEDREGQRGQNGVHPAPPESYREQPQLQPEPALQDGSEHETRYGDAQHRHHHRRGIQ